MKQPLPLRKPSRRQNLHIPFLRLLARLPKFLTKVSPRLILVSRIVALALIGSIPAPAAYAASLTVNTTSDLVVAGDGQCSLREAILNANNDLDNTGGDCASGSGA